MLYSSNLVNEISCSLSEDREEVKAKYKLLSYILPAGSVNNYGHGKIIYLKKITSLKNKCIILILYFQ